MRLLGVAEEPISLPEGQRSAAAAATAAGAATSIAAHVTSAIAVVAAVAVAAVAVAKDAYLNRFTLIAQ